ncbi:protein RTM1 [Penicillium diatomitis]|uniref:Protein RTM1 n=1 Tax=Penicillium diatomitis TaxID=2819901 RepID=A0A9W9XI56_9EURO|nr:protein RTM1 [Penicillium diatomitis]KAJ5492814.1 protein RTM1 [Penicillium diatomitis]
MGWVHWPNLVEHREPRLDDGPIYPSDMTAVTGPHIIRRFDIYDAGENYGASSSRKSLPLQEKMAHKDFSSHCSLIRITSHQWARAYMEYIGGGVMAGDSLSAVHNGEEIVIAGLVIQIFFFGLFIITCALFHKRVRKFPTARSLELSRTWRKYLHILYTANLLIVIRSIFRLIEYAMGNNGYILRYEVFLYVFDGLLMLLVMVLFNVVHPSGLISHKSDKTRRTEMNALP